MRKVVESPCASDEALSRLCGSKLVRAYLGQYGLRPVAVRRVLVEPTGTVYLATLSKPQRLRQSPRGPVQGKPCAAVFVILRAGPPAHFPDNWPAQINVSPAKAVLRWYLGGVSSAFFGSKRRRTSAGAHRGANRHRALHGGT